MADRWLFRNQPVVDNHRQPLLRREKVVVALLVSVLVLLPFSRLAELPIAILSLIGLWQLACSFHWRVLLCRAVSRQRAFWSNPATWVLGVVYLGYLGMIVISAPDSYWPEKTWQVALASLRFWLAGVAVLIALRSRQAVELLIRYSGLVAAFWAVDALFQYVLGVDLIGRVSDPLRLSGIFGAGNAKLGPVLAFLLPFLLQASRSWVPVVRWFVVLAAVVVIVLTGTRSAWLMAAFVLLLWWWQGPVRHWQPLLLSLLASMILAVILWQFSPAFQQRVDRTLVALQGTEQALDYALADRLPIWKAGLAMFREHPVNGVGARAFRKAYTEFAPPGNVWQAQGGTAMHAHHWILEILAETGMLGLMMFSLPVLILWRWVHHCGLDSLNWPFAVALSSMFLPVVSMYSLFASFWAICIWWVGVGLLVSTAASCRKKIV